MRMFEMLGVTDALILVALLVGLVIISLFSNRKSKSSDDFNNGGKSLTLWVAVGSSIATFMGAYTGGGHCELAFSSGMVALTIIMGSNVGWIAQNALSRPLRTSGANTLAEFITKKYSATTRKIASFITVIYTLAALAGQFIAAGVLFEMIGIGSRTVGITVAAFVIIVLTLVGGLKGVAVTNTIQTVFIVVVCVVVVPILTFSKAGGVGFVMANTPPEKLGMLSNMPPLMILGYFLASGLPFCAEPAIIQRVISAKDPKTAFKSSVISNILSLIMTIPITLAVFTAPFILPEITSGAQFYPGVIMNYLPVVIKGAALFAFMSLFLTTGDAYLHATSSNIVYDFIKPMDPDMDDKKLLNISRILLVVIGLVGLVIALMGGSIYQVMLTGGAAFGAGLVPPILFACFSKRKYNTKNVNAGMLVGCLFTIIWDMSGMNGRTGMPGVVIGTILCVILCMINSKAPDQTAVAAAN